MSGCGNVQCFCSGLCLRETYDLERTGEANNGFMAALWRENERQKKIDRDRERLVSDPCD